MRRYLIGGVRFLLVSAGIVALTSVSIDATDFLRGSQSALGIFATNVVTPSCPQGMVEVERPDRSRFCIDQYEVSPSDDCVYREPGSPAQSAVNSNDVGCASHSGPRRQPWTQVLQTQAEQICSRAGKRLPTADEWYLAARGTPDSARVCNIDAGPQPTGAKEQCVSGAGAYDMIGGVWEWVAEQVSDGRLGAQLLPTEGYITSVTAEGVPRTSSTSPELAFNSDYVWSEAQGQYAVMRGGFYGSRADGGVYALHAATPLDFAAPTVGFRCALSL